MNIVIVGCGNVGLETARLLGREHAVLLINRSRSPDLDDFLAERSDVAFVLADATDEGAINRAVRDFVTRMGRVDVLVSTVGSAGPGLATEDFDEFEKSFMLNVFGNLVPMKAALGHMIVARSGKIVVLSSVSGVFAYPSLTAYVPAKWALTALCESLRREVAQHGISLDVIFPGSIRNRRSRTFLFKDGLAVERVAAEVCRAMNTSRGMNRFVPRWYVLLRPVERLFPVVFDRRAGLKAGRAARFRGRKTGSVLVAGDRPNLVRRLGLLYSRSAERLYLAGPRAVRLSGAKTEIKQSSSCPTDVIYLDVTDESAIERLAACVPRVDLFINAVSPSLHGRFMDTPVAAFEDSLRAGFLGPARLTGKLLRREKIGGKIVMVLSSPPSGGRAGCSGCAAGRAALWAFARVLRRSVGSNMQVTEIMVGTCPRGHCAQNDGQDATAAQDAFDSVLARRIMQAERSGKEIVAIGRHRSAVGRRDHSHAPCGGELPR